MTAAVSKAKWLKAHLGSDRALLRLTLPSSLVEETERKADALGVSLTAYVSAALAIAVDHRDEIPLRIRLLERVHRIKFRGSQVSASPHNSAPAPNDQEAS